VASFQHTEREFLADNFSVEVQSAFFTWLRLSSVVSGGYSTGDTKDYF